MIVYVITKGCYSDYHVCGVAIDRQAANRLKKLYSDSVEEAYIEEYDTEKPLSVSERIDKGYMPYKIAISNGAIVNICILDKDDVSCLVDYLSGAPGYKFREELNKGWVYCFAKDAEHAKKLHQTYMPSGKLKRRVLFNDQH